MMKKRVHEGEKVIAEYRTKASSSLGTEATLHTLKNDSKEKSDAITHLESQVEQLKKSIEFKDRVIDALKTETSPRSKSFKANDDVVIAAQKLEEAEVLNLQLVKKMEAMKKEFGDKKQELRSSKAEVARLEGELEKAVNHSKRDQAISLRDIGSSSSNSADIEKFEKVIRELRRRLSDVKSESEVTQQQIKGYELEVNTLRRQLEQSQDRNDALKEHLEAFVDRNRQIGVQLAAAQQANNRLAPAERPSDEAAVTAAVTAERRHNYRQMKGLVEQIKYLRCKADRESGYRADLEFMKRFFLIKIQAYQACNRADLAMLEEMGIYPDYEQLSRQQGNRVSLKAVGQMVVAAIRFRNRGHGLREQIRMKEEVKARLKR